MTDYVKKIALAMVTIAAIIPATVNAQSKVQIAAHRGYWQSEKAKESQNSIMALKQAQKNDIWGVELDVHLTSDNVIIVNHDPTIEGKKIRETPYDELKEYKLQDGEPRPTFDQFLKQGAKSPSKIVLEIKDQYNDQRSIQLADLCIQKLIDHGMFDPEKVMFISFNLAVCKHLAQVAPQFTNQYLTGDIDPDTLHSYGINGIDYHYSVLQKHPEWVKRSHDLGMSVNAWTVDEEKDMKNMIDLGVDCITTNKPLIVRNQLGNREMKPEKR